MNTYEVGGPGPNIAYKGIAVRLDAGAGGVSRGKSWALFDHDTLAVRGGLDGRRVHRLERHPLQRPAPGSPEADRHSGTSRTPSGQGGPTRKRAASKILDSRPRRQALRPAAPPVGTVQGHLSPTATRRSSRYTVGDATILEVEGDRIGTARTARCSHARWRSASPPAICSPALRRTERPSPSSVTARCHWSRQDGFHVLHDPRRRHAHAGEGADGEGLRPTSRPSPGPRPPRGRSSRSREGGPKRWPEVLKTATDTRQEPTARSPWTCSAFRSETPGTACSG